MGLFDPEFITKPEESKEYYRNQLDIACQAPRPVFKKFIFKTIMVLVYLTMTSGKVGAAAMTSGSVGTRDNQKPFVCSADFSGWYGWRLGLIWRLTKVLAHTCWDELTETKGRGSAWITYTARTEVETGMRM